MTRALHSTLFHSPGGVPGTQSMPDGWMDGRTDGRTDTGETEILMSNIELFHFEYSVNFFIVFTDQDIKLCVAHESVR